MEEEDYLETLSFGKEAKAEEDLWGKTWLDEEISPPKVDVEPLVEAGDICRVTNDNRIYPFYYQFSNDAGHPDIQEKNYVTFKDDFIIKNEEVRVLFSKQNPENSQREIIAIVETIDNPVYLKFMIGETGLELISSKRIELQKNINLFVENYLSGKLLKEKVPDEYVCEFLLKAIVLTNPMDIQYVNTNLLTDEHYKRVLLEDGGLLGLLPVERRTLDLCKLALAEEPYAEKFIPEELKSLIKY